MKKLLIALTLIASPAYAKESVLSCFVVDTKEHVVIIGNDGNVRLQWNGGPFEYGTASFEEDRFLIVKQFSNGGTFRLVYDATSGYAYGGTVFYSGKENKSYFNCKWQ